MPGLTTPGTNVMDAIRLVAVQASVADDATDTAADVAAPVQAAVAGAAADIADNNVVAVDNARAALAGAATDTAGAAADVAAAADSTGDLYRRHCGLHCPHSGHRFWLPAVPSKLLLSSSTRTMPPSRLSRLKFVLNSKLRFSEAYEGGRPFKTRRLIS